MPALMYSFREWKLSLILLKKTIAQNDMGNWHRRFNKLSVKCFFFVYTRKNILNLLNDQCVLDYDATIKVGYLNVHYEMICDHFTEKMFYS